MTAVKESGSTKDDLKLYAPQVQQTPIKSSEKEGLRARIAQLEQALAAGERREQSLRAARAKLRQALARQKLLNATLVKSASWRITAPLRAAVDAFRTFGDVLRGVVRHNRQKIISPEVAAFHKEGFLAPVDLFTPAQCALIVNHYQLHARPNRHKVHKALAAHDRFFYDLSTRPSLLGSA